MSLFGFMYAVRAARTFILLIILLLLYIILIWLKQDTRVCVPKKWKQKFLVYDELNITEVVDVDKLKIKIRELNDKREVTHWKRFGSVKADTTVLVVQVHQDLRRLQYLIVSLAEVQFIDSVLLVFSHSYYSEQINQLIGKIDFCRVMQIFYPNSVQIYPDRFPGVDPEDCPYGTHATPLTFCQDRDARKTEPKQHWWWKANLIFDRMPWSRTYTGTVIFLEEHHYAVPDLIHMLNFVQRSLSYFPDVEIMSFGKMFVEKSDTHLLTLDYWRPPYDVGIAFNKTTWRKIVALSSFYCMYDDCSWSYSMLNLFKNFMKGNVNMVACVAPRVISTKQFDNLDRAGSEMCRQFRYSQLYPEKVEAVFLFGTEGRVQRDGKFPSKGNGGWKDIRDHLLCLDPLTTASDYDALTST